ncbi:MAG: CopG family transcriptional regulator [Thermodesulfobacteriota bacterium]|nr:CopG family transcriptional regulator [Thermodesulfobacteriota bacterium]
MKTFSLKLPESLLARLTSAAMERGENKSALVREALEIFITGDNQSPKGSCLDLAKDLIGCVNGPADLSFNKKHMHGYGQ